MQAEYYDRDRYEVGDGVLERHRSAATTALSRDRYGHLIGGEWVDAADGEEGQAIDATTGEPLATVQIGSPADVDRAVEAAREAFEGSWGQLSPRQRAERLEEIADRLEDRKTEIAKVDSLEAGKPNLHALFVDCEVLIEQFRHFAALARSTDEGRVVPTGDEKRVFTRREPYGVVGAISAWNFPAMFVAWKLGPALATGNTVVLKPSERAALSSLEVARICDRVLPPGTVNVVTGFGEDVGAAMTAHDDVDKLSLTGSRGAGVATLESAAQTITPTSLELGGKSPNIVFPDADLELAIEGTLVSIFFNSGQQCTAGSRLYLHEDIRDEFLERLRTAVEGLTVGDPLGPTTDVGPMIDHAHAESVRDYVETAVAEGATPFIGGDDATAAVDDDLAGAPFVRPTVLTDVDDEATVGCEEVFGPVLSVFEWSDREEVLRRANDTSYGLAAGVWTEDLRAAHEFATDLEAGTVWINTYNDLFDPAPHGGYKESGTGRELAEEALEDYSQVKTVKVNLGGVPKMG
ncbi:aldehyde dehydrogenase family protein [Haloterrigena alkaliphila]|uniref:Aldehyde dehydrogenase n=1 Tax=Haloterrigena alkaliphila TaxID=2816475 RepID=A0A8A2VHQ1_9EURY|nr:aldehyde dehydrogenase family protein [Haloterrigena alkaliphila]QSW99852.1 aldehyde dehydrogenase family protein [Haloterrigena alkaliphila]